MVFLLFIWLFFYKYESRYIISLCYNIDMKLYHGSKGKFLKLERQQAQSTVEVPKDEVLNAIYLTPDYGRALAMGCCPEGKNDFDDNNHKIIFENPQLFNPNEDIYIYVVDSEMIPEDKLKLGENGFDYVADMDEIIPKEIKETKAFEILDFYELTNWKGNNEIKNEITNPIRLK